MAKKVTSYIKLQVPAGQANPSPPVGPALGQHGVNIMEFCKAFNAQTQGEEPGLPIPVIITVYADRSFTFISKTPPAAVLCCARLPGVPKGSGEPNMEKVGKVNRKAARRDCDDQNARSHGRRHGCRSTYRRGHCPKHGYRDGGREIMARINEAQETGSREGRARPSCMRSTKH